MVDSREERETIEREFCKALDEVISLFRVPNIADFFPTLAWLDLHGLAKKMRKL